MRRLRSSIGGSAVIRRRSLGRCGRWSRRRCLSWPMKGLRLRADTSRALRCDFRELRAGAPTNPPLRPTRWLTSRRSSATLAPTNDHPGTQPGVGCDAPSGVCHLEIPRRSAEVADLAVLLLGEVQRLAGQVAVTLGLVYGLGEQEPLPQLATQLTDLVELLPTLNTLGHHLNIEIAGHRNNCADNGKVARVRDQVANEAAVDLEVVHAPALQIGQARVAGPEVINGNPDTQLAQLGHGVLVGLTAAAFAPLTHGALGALTLQRGGPGAVLAGARDDGSR